MNTPRVTRLPDGRLRLTIQSDGERDQSVTLTEDELDDLIDAAEAESDPVSRDLLRDQVAQAIATADKGAWEVSGHTVIVAGELEQADAAIGVVFAVVADEIKALRWPNPDEPNSRIADDVHGWRAYRSHEKAIDAMLAVVARLRG